MHAVLPRSLYTAHDRHAGAPASAAAGTRLVVAAAASSTERSGSTPLVHDGRLPFLKTLQQFVAPREYADAVLQGHTFAWGKTGLLPSKDTLFIADADSARSLMASELQLGIQEAMLGLSSISMTGDPHLHSRLRQTLGMSFTKEAVNNMLPQLQATAAAHLARWEAATADTHHSSSSSSSSTDSGSPSSSSSSSRAAPLSVGLTTTAGGSCVLGYPAVRLLTFDVLVNQVLGLQMTDGEIQQYASLFETLVDGFVPPAWDLPFTAYGKGLAARRQLSERIQSTLRTTQCRGAMARLRDEFGADSPVAIDNTITLLFAGFDTTSSSLSYMLWLLAQHPSVLDKVHAEQAAVVANHGSALTPEAYRNMPYTIAVIKETLRLAQIIAYVPRQTTTEAVRIGSSLTLPAGCPFLVALAAISASDPALQGSQAAAQQFRPERWLDPAAAKSLSQYQLPFGTGQRTCLGVNLAYAEMAAVLSELSRSYTLTAQADTDWVDFPIKRPANSLPIRLDSRQAGTAGSHRVHPGAGALSGAGVV